MKKVLEFHHGALADSYEKQANAQGYTYGKDAKWVQKVGFGLVCAYVHGCITDSEYDKILRRFQQKILINPRFLKRLESEDQA